MTTSPNSQHQLNLLLTKSISPQWTQLKIDHCLLHNDFLIMVIFLFSSWGKKTPKANSLICFIFKISQHTPCLWISKCLNVPHPWAMPKKSKKPVERSLVCNGPEISQESLSWTSAGSEHMQWYFITLPCSNKSHSKNQGRLPWSCFYTCSVLQWNLKWCDLQSWKETSRALLKLLQTRKTQQTTSGVL